MKDLFIFLFMAPLALALTLSCTSEPSAENTSSNDNVAKSSSSVEDNNNNSTVGDKSSNSNVAKSSSSSNSNSNSTSNGNYGSQAAENGQAYNMETEKPYKVSSKIYMADKNDLQLVPTFDDAKIEVGTMSNGEIFLNLPENIDSRYLTKLNFAPTGINVEPLGTEMWFQVTPLRLIDNNGNHIGNLTYAKMESDVESYRVLYWYFSKNTKINGSFKENFEEGDVTFEYKIDAKKGWNKFYMYVSVNEMKITITTDLSNTPDGLKWLVKEK